ncbi:hypothetical protein Gogos_001905 [Gossypium gossypioides]|uniref:DUF4283 domain-containing protein n=1 Tax=Gossypium gossypioides TaxID=34282 RepID=A0A7J9CQC1_GOSGO|nr:hypothetical protein [Gossypium gossypioides]
MNSLCENAVSGDYFAEGLIPKKVHFRDKDESVNMDILVDHVGQPTASWKKNLVGSSSTIGGEDLEVNKDFEVLEGDIQKSIINGIQCILIQDIEKTVILKLLGHNIVHLMDIENGFFLAKFVNKIDYEKVLSEGPWIIFGQYLTVQPWTVSFDRTQTFLSMVMSWIRFSGLLGYMYKCKILVEIGGLVGKVTKLDMDTDNRVRDRFARMGVYVTLDRPLVSQVLINGKIQRVKYEFLLKVCFYYRRFSHMKNVCPFTISEPRVEKNLPSSETLQVVVSMTVEETSENSGSYGPWMLVEERSR